MRSTFRSRHDRRVANATIAANAAQLDVIDVVTSADQKTSRGSAAAPPARNRISAALDCRLGSLLRLSAIAFTFLVTALFVAVYQLLGPTAPWLIYGGAAFAGLLCVPGARPYRNAAVVALVGLWACFAATAAEATLWNPTWKIVINDTRGFTAAALITVGITLMSRGRLQSAVALRALWLAVFALSAPMGIWEMLSGEHPLRPATSPWTGPPHSPSSYFVNPNNYAVILVVTIGIALLWLTERTSRWWRICLLLATLVASILLWQTQSRAGVAGALVAALGAGLLAAGRAGLLARGAHWRRRHPFALRIVGAGAALALLCAFAIPSLAARNPVLSLLLPGDADTVRSDSARLALIRHGIDFWRTSPWTGIGAARYEWALAAVDHPDVPRVLPAHNGFVELLAERGLAMAAPLAVLLVVLAWRAIRPAQGVTRRDPQHSEPGAAFVTGRPRHLDERGGRCLLALYLAGFALAGVVVSSPLMWFPWWLLLASATSTSWWLDSRRSPHLKSNPKLGQDSFKIPSSSTAAELPMGRPS
ncbi:O-antigen ligase family protein [Gephyromycinifex aptenodytis]|uniref:O-antigen ligase family protein n=1 Tax=Gephyromycinifex aptenodytis TaxID=2716227 RepID=UPI0014464FF0|nr:O-antigen ligase family protein [Gephyromycinifex aptenodytis]